jgi:hypothetical protein
VLMLSPIYLFSSPVAHFKFGIVVATVPISEVQVGAGVQRNSVANQHES